MSCNLSASSKNANSILQHGPGNTWHPKDMKYAAILTTALASGALFLHLLGVAMSAAV